MFLMGDGCRASSFVLLQEAKIWEQFKKMACWHTVPNGLEILMAPVLALFLLEAPHIVLDGPYPALLLQGTFR
jgi:hypothetical protein